MASRLSLAAAKAGKIILYRGSPALILEAKHSLLGRGVGRTRLKLKNLQTAGVFEVVFQGQDTLQEVAITVKEAQFLYPNGQMLAFLDQETFEEIKIEAKLVPHISFLPAGTPVKVRLFEGKPLGVELPTKVRVKVTDAPPGIRGNTKEATSKEVTLATGAKIRAPLFVQTGQTILIEPSSGAYRGKI